MRATVEVQLFTAIEVLKEALPVLRAAATAEARSNRAPTGLKPIRTKRDLLAAAEGIIAATEAVAA